MYTFGILAVLSFILAGAIFGKKIKENQLTVAMIVFASTLLGSIIVNGIIGMDTPYTLIKIRTKELSDQHTFVLVMEDTIIDQYMRLQYIYDMEVEEDGDTSLTHYVDVGGSYDNFYSGEESDRKLFVDILPEGDSIDIVDIYRYKRIPDNRWVSKLGLPGGGREFHVHLQDIEKNHVLIDQLNEKFFTDERKSIAQLD